MPYSVLLSLHLVMVSIFLVLYLIKTILLFTNPNGLFEQFRKITLFPEILVSMIFLITGVWMLFDIAEVKNMLLIKLALTGLTIPFAVVAFKRKYKLLATISFILLISIYGLAEMAKQVKANHVDSKVLMAAASYTPVRHGQILYNQYCVNCHGGDGEGEYSGAKRLSVSLKEDAAIVTVIKNGKAAMPKYAKVFNEDEIKALTQYIKTLRK